MTLPDEVFRYDGDSGVVTPLDPIEDCTSWISGLRSKGYTSDILRTVHGATKVKDIHDRADLIAIYSSNAVGFIDQAYSGPAEISFLPLYYSILNLSKAYIAIAGSQKLLITNRRHGVSYNTMRRPSKDILDDEVTAWTKGVFPVFYSIITGEILTNRDISIRLRDIYPYITNIAHEYEHAYSRKMCLQPISIRAIEYESKKFRFHVNLVDSDCPFAFNRRYLKLFRGFNRLDPKNPKVLVSPGVTAASIEKAVPILKSQINRFLIYHSRTVMGDILPLTPLSAKRYYLPEEVPIWIAFFHLSSIARYKPEFLAQLIDSKSWPILLSLRKHSILKFLLLFWSFLHQSSYHLIIA